MVMGLNLCVANEPAAAKPTAVEQNETQATVAQEVKATATATVPSAEKIQKEK